MSQVDREVNATNFWGKIILGTILIPSIGGFVYVGGLENRVSNNEKNIVKLEQEVSDIEDDIQKILIFQERIISGVEQVKIRLGIVELQ